MIHAEEFTDEMALRDLGVRQWRGVTSDALTWKLHETFSADTYGRIPKRVVVGF